MEFSLWIPFVFTVLANVISITGAYWNLRILIVRLEERVKTVERQQIRLEHQLERLNPISS